MMRKHLEAEFLALIERYGLSPDKPEDGWKLAEALYMDRFQVNQKPGVKADPRHTAQDLILWAAVECAEQETGIRNVTATISALKEHNGWKESVPTLRRRYYDLRKDGTPEHKRAIGLARRLGPYFEARLEELEKKRK